MGNRVQEEPRVVRWDSARAAPLVLLVLLLAGCGGWQAFGTPRPAVPRVPGLLAACGPQGLPNGQMLCYTPAEMRRAYDIQPLLNRGISGAGRRIVVVALGQTAVRNGSPAVDIAGSLRDYDRYFALPTPRLRILAPFGGRVVSTASGVETVTDLEMAHAVAPGAALTVLVVNSGHVSGTGALGQVASANGFARNLARGIRFTVRHHLGDVLSVSYAVLSTCVRPTVLHTLHSALRLARARHVTVVAAAGDWGALQPVCTLSARTARPGISDLAADPLVTTVGGTTLRLQSGSGRYVGEVAWNSHLPAPRHRFSTFLLDGSATGGGISSTASIPPYQVGIPGLRVHRGVPDVAFDADVNTGPATIVKARAALLSAGGGTSLGAPVWAGIAALADQAAGRRLGFLNAALYRIGRSRLYRRAFHDVLSGNNTVTVMSPLRHRITVPGFTAGPGWDAVTGWGTPRVAALVPLLVHAVHPADGEGL